MTGIAGILEEHIPGVYVHRIMIGGNLLVDTESGFFRDTNRQVELKIFCLDLFGQFLVTFYFIFRLEKFAR